MEGDVSNEEPILAPAAACLYRRRSFAQTLRWFLSQMYWWLWTIFFFFTNNALPYEDICKLATAIHALQQFHKKKCSKQHLLISVRCMAGSWDIWSQKNIGANILCLHSLTVNPFLKIQPPQLEFSWGSHDIFFGIPGSATGFGIPNIP